LRGAPGSPNINLQPRQDSPVTSAEDNPLTFEAAMRELEEIVSALEKGNVDLEKSIALYERGEFLKKHCDALLKSAEARIDKIVQGADGAAKGVAPLDVE
jgi:exodeoxyribonuclease VII small subunit